MIKSKQKVVLTKQTILKRVSTYDIYRYYQGPFNLGEVCINRHRGEKDPSLIISVRPSGEITHKDFGNMRWRGDAFSFVQQIYHCDYGTALHHIDKDLNLGISNTRVEGKAVITWPQPKTEIKKPPIFHIVYYSKMDKRGLEYWSKFGQGEDDLRRERVFQPKEIWRNFKKIPLGDFLTFVFYYDDIDKWKIYRPFGVKRDLKTPLNQWKWDSNVPFNYIDNKRILDSGCKDIFLTKSKKDRMVLMKALGTECIVDVQAEDPACLNDETLEKLKKVPNRFVISDNDDKGKQFSWWLTKGHGFRHVNVPDSYRDSEPKCTDFADLCYHYGMEKVSNHFKIKDICV